MLSSVPPEKAGSASGVVQTNSEFGYALGIAVIGSLGTLVYRFQIAGHLPTELPATAADDATESLTGASTVAGELSGSLSTAVLAAAGDAFSSALHTVATIAGVAAAALAGLIVTKLRHIPPLDQGEAERELRSTATPRNSSTAPPSAASMRSQASLRRDPGAISG